MMSKNIDTAALVDITTVSVDKNLPQYERCAEFKRQIKDMHNYKCKGQHETFTIKALYAVDGTKLEDCLRGMLA